jgi:hypothetical protein
MGTRWFRLAGLTLLFSTLLTPAARADTRFDLRIGIPGRAVAAPYRFESRPSAGVVWRPGYYVWTGHRRHWVPGRWIRPVYEYRRPSWRYDRRGYGYDRRDRGDRWRDRDWRR